MMKSPPAELLASQVPPVCGAQPNQHKHRARQLRGMLLGALVTAIAASTVATAKARPVPAAPPVIAIVGESGMNVLHEDFRTGDGSTPRYPAALGPVVLVTLPRGGSFAARRAAVAAGPLGHLVPGTLYGVRGTRLLVAAAPGTHPQTDVTGAGTTTITVGSSDDPTLHGTGVVDAAIGMHYGTSPASLALLVLGTTTDAWAFVADRPGIDVASTSSYQVGGLCDGAAAVRAFVDAGHLVFSSAGNTTDQAESVTAPNGLPEVYQVGGVNADGTPYGLPPHLDADPFYAVGQSTRPYQTGELYDFPTATYADDHGVMRFGGTSGATPRTAGWAADLIIEARRLLSTRRPTAGPLSDGIFSGGELTELLHHVAEPALPDTAAGTVVEGFGALNARAIEMAKRVLRGETADPARPFADATEALITRARTVAFSPCS